MTLDQKLDALLLLEAGWDGYGGEPINPACVAAARALLRDPLFAANPPRVVATSGGGVQLEWATRGYTRSLELGFDPAEPLLADWMKHAEGMERALEGTWRVENPGEARELLAWFLEDE